MSGSITHTVGNNMQEEHGDGNSTIVEICNETGSSATLLKSHSWDGDVWKYPFAPSIATGQRGVCLHVPASESGTGSAGAVVYRVKNADGTQFDVFVGWSTMTSGSNKAYVECRGLDHWWATGTKDIMQNLIEASGTISTDLARNGINVVASIGQSSSPVLTFSIGVV